MRWWWAMVAMVGCIKQVAPVQAPAGTSMRLVVVIDAVDGDEVTAAPSEVEEAVDRALRQRGVIAEGTAADLEAFARLRSTEARLQHLVARAASPVLLVEAQPRFSAQVNGRYRWEVRGTVTASGAVTLSEDFRAPAHLIYSHQDEDDALLDTKSVVATRAGRLVDEWIVVAPPAEP